ncbi:MAG: coenzyme F420-0:L-glutamate ligase [Alphaproteobacteria bacterium]
MPAATSFTAISGIGEVEAGADLADMIGAALDASALRLAPQDVLVVAQKIVSKAEGRAVELGTVKPSASARDLAASTGKDPRLVELILSESDEVLRHKPGVIVVAHRLGFVMANAGIDRSNVKGAGETVLLLPKDPDASAEALRRRFFDRTRTPIGVIISDSFGRAWRNGVVNVALGVAGLPALIDRRGEHDRYGRRLEVTQVAFADAIAAGAGLVMGEAGEGTPAVLVRGLAWDRAPTAGDVLIRPKAEDMFR